MPRPDAWTWRSCVTPRSSVYFGRGGHHQAVYSPWSSLLHIAPTPSGSWRQCGDYGQLHMTTVHGKYPFPNLAGFSINFQLRVFQPDWPPEEVHQVPMAVAEVAKTAIVIHSASSSLHAVIVENVQTFQRLMDCLFRHLHFLVNYINNPLIASRSLGGALGPHGAVFRHSEEHRLKVNPAKKCFVLLFECFPCIDLDTWCYDEEKKTFCTMIFRSFYGFQYPLILGFWDFFKFIFVATVSDIEHWSLEIERTRRRLIAANLMINWSILFWAWPRNSLAKKDDINYSKGWLGLFNSLKLFFSFWWPNLTTNCENPHNLDKIKNHCT